MIAPFCSRSGRSPWLVLGPGSFLMALALAAGAASAETGLCAAHNGGVRPPEVRSGVPLSFARAEHASGVFGDGLHSTSVASVDADLSPFATPETRIEGGKWSQESVGILPDSGTQNYHRSAILTSLLIPGLAQYRMGEKERGLAFLTLEAAFWTSFTAFRIQGANREDSYVEMAELFAGISPDAPRDEDFYKAISNWPSSDLYNEIVVRRLARTQGGDDIAAREAYYEENKVQGNETWDWTSEFARDQFQTKRTESQRSYKRSRNMVGLAVANRVVAMIDAVLLSNRLHDSGYGLEMTQERNGSDFVTHVGVRRRLP